MYGIIKTASENEIKVQKEMMKIPISKRFTDNMEEIIPIQ